METLIHAQRELWNDAIAIHMAERKPFGLCVAQPATFVEQPEGSLSEPFMRLRIDDAQRLMDELWHCGLRPSEGTPPKSYELPRCQKCGALLHAGKCW